MRVLLLAAITVDGKIARTSDELSDWSSREDRRFFARTTREAGVVIMGRRTFATLPRSLPGRLTVVMTRTPPERAAERLESLEGVEYTSEAPERILEGLAARGYSAVVVAGGAQVYRAYLTAGLVDEVWLTLEPLALGAGISLFGDAPLGLRFTLLEMRPLGANSVQLRYAVAR
jgi:dihydrofolate reductase